MAALVDTSFLFALANENDRNHARVLEVARTLAGPIILPVSVLPEICYLLASRLGHGVMRQFLSELVTGDTVLESITDADLRRTLNILEQYADGKLDFVDATIVAVAERLGIERVLTLDRRDFSIIRPRHCQFFEILPH